VANGAAGQGETPAATRGSPFGSMKAGSSHDTARGGKAKYEAVIREWRKSLLYEALPILI